MTLATPLALLGLLTLPVIIALHAVRARNRQQVVSSLALWNFLDPQISGARARRIPFSWLLVVDLLIATLLTLALTQPELSLTRTVPNARHMIILLDVSTSMTATDETPSRFAQAQADATDLLRTLTPRDTATLITFASSAQTIADTRTSILQSLISNLLLLTPGETGSDLSSALALANAAKASDLPLEIHFFTDAAFQASISDLSHPIVLHSYGNSANNQSILNLAPSPLSAQKLQLFARIANFASEPVTRRLTLLADDNPITTIEITLDPKSTLPYTWDILGNPTRLTVQLEGSDNLPADDSASLGLNTPPAIRVALVAKYPAPVDRALDALPNTDVQLIHPSDYLPGSPFDLVIFKDKLPDEKPTSNTIILSPPAESSESFNPSQIILQPHPFLVDLDFTGLRNLQSSTFTLPPWLADYDLQTILEAEGAPLLQHGQTGQTQTTLFSIQLNAGNLTQHPAFILLLNNILTYYRNLAIPEQIPLGSLLHIPTGTGAEVTTPNNSPTQFTSPCPCPFSDTRTPGLYHLELIGTTGSAQTYWIGVNAGDLLESDITPNQFSMSSNQPSIPSTLEEPVQLAPYLLALTLAIFLLQAYLSWK